MIIDATDLIAGRLATFAAKKALEGESIIIVNSEKAVITGKKHEILARFRQKVARGIPLKGPYYPRMPDRILRRMIRGMLPYKQQRGKEAFKRVMCYIGVPDQYKSADVSKLEHAHISRLANPMFLRIGDISKELGAKLRI